MAIYGPNQTDEQRKMRAIEDEVDRLRSEIATVHTVTQRPDAPVPNSVMVAMTFVNRFQATTQPQLIGCPIEGEAEMIWRVTRSEEDCTMDSACQLLQDYFDESSRVLRCGKPRSRQPHPEVEE